MGVIVLLIIACIIFAGGFLAAFLWAVKSGQFDDPYTPSMRILLDDNIEKVEKTNSHSDIRNSCLINKRRNN
jgi:cbb3-type cytochrome oxidase maturation protein